MKKIKISCISFWNNSFIFHFSCTWYHNQIITSLVWIISTMYFKYSIFFLNIDISFLFLRTCSQFSWVFLTYNCGRDYMPHALHGCLWLLLLSPSFLFFSSFCFPASRQIFVVKKTKTFNSLDVEAGQSGIQIWFWLLSEMEASFSYMRHCLI